MTGCCARHGQEELFGDRFAKRVAKRYRKKGPDAMVRALARRGWVELERAPHHHDSGRLRLAGEAGERAFEAALSDEAPRAGDIRPDVDA